MSAIEPYLLLVSQSARNFAHRFQAQLRPSDNDASVRLSPELLNACQELGWLDALTDGTEPSDEPQEPRVLAALLHEIAKLSPSLSARLICHHFARRWCLLAAQPASPPLQADPPCDWMCIPADCLASRVDEAPHSLLLEDHLRVHGRSRNIIGGDLARTLVTTAKQENGAPALVLIELGSGTCRNSTNTIGLEAAGFCDFEFTQDNSASISIVESQSPLVSDARNRALSFILPGYAALCRAIFANCHDLARSHASSRTQGGGLLLSLPPIRERLSAIERAIALAELIERAQVESASAPDSLLVPLRKALFESTDAAMQVLAGVGYVSPIMTSLWRDSRQIAALFGSNLGLLT